MNNHTHTHTQLLSVGQDGRDARSNHKWISVFLSLDCWWQIETLHTDEHCLLFFSVSFFSYLLSILLCFIFYYHWTVNSYQAHRCRAKFGCVLKLSIHTSHHMGLTWARPLLCKNCKLISVPFESATFVWNVYTKNVRNKLPEAFGKSSFSRVMRNVW